MKGYHFRLKEDLVKDTRQKLETICFNVKFRLVSMIMTRLVKEASSVFIFSIFLVAVSALCSHPCSRVNRGTFVDEQNTYTFSCYNTSILTVNGGEELRECYTRLGAFLVVRNGNRYRCVKHTLYDRTARIVFVYVTPYKTFLTEPSICDVCSGTFTLALFVVNTCTFFLFTKTGKPPALGCNRPPLCPITDYANDRPCTGCEPQEDDGLCCATCSSFFIGGRNVSRYISGGDWRWIKQGKMTKMEYFDFDSNEPNGSFAIPQDCLLLNGGRSHNL
ncbi:ATG4 [Mytilus coruscus]|uniref:ATG4 n=1 Tax=Mytilus coruscus TaxID=42192 RepID=A0A6J8E2Q2_MYTCO|nr:ATG4 [Mytilus coruscus]